MTEIGNILMLKSWQNLKASRKLATVPLHSLAQKIMEEKFENSKKPSRSWQCCMVKIGCFDTKLWRKLECDNLFGSLQSTEVKTKVRCMSFSVQYSISFI